MHGFIPIANLLPKVDWDQFSSNLLDQGSEVVFTSLRITCNGTLLSLHVPLELRGRDFRFWDDALHITVSVWTGTAGLVRVGGFDARILIDAPTVQRDGDIFILKDSDVVQMTGIVPLDVEITQTAIISIQTFNSVRRQVNDSGDVLQDQVIAEHWPLLFHPDTQIPLMSAAFTASTSNPTPSEG